MVRLKKIYQDEIVPKLKEEFQFKNVHEVPKLVKIVASCVTRDCVQNGKIVDSIKMTCR